MQKGLGVEGRQAVADDGPGLFHEDLGLGESQAGVADNAVDAREPLFEFVPVLEVDDDLFLLQVLLVFPLFFFHFFPCILHQGQDQVGSHFQHINAV